MFEENNLRGRDDLEQNVPQNSETEGRPSGVSHYYYSTTPSYQTPRYSAPANTPAPSDAPMAPSVPANLTAGKKPRRDRKNGTVSRIVAIAIVVILSIVLGGVSGYVVADMKQFGTSGGKVIIYESSGNDSMSQILDSDATIAEIAKKVAPSVVEITTEVVKSGGFMSQYIVEGAGSGVIISTDGYVITNNHVIENAKTISVILNNGESYPAQLIGTDVLTDIAVVKIEVTGLIPVTFGSSKNLEVGDFALAVGNPLGELGGTVTNGIISALEREGKIDGINMTLLQTNAAINPGNSGGGLFNSSGELIGVVNAKAAGEDIEGLGFAVPIDIARPVAEDIITNGYVTGRVMAGVQLLDVLDYATAFQYRVSELGPYIYVVNEDSDAERAGLKSGDLVMKVDGTLVYESSEIVELINECEVGDTLTFTVMRNGKEMEIPLTFTEYKPT